MSDDTAAQGAEHPPAPTHSPVGVVPLSGRRGPAGEIFVLEPMPWPEVRRTYLVRLEAPGVQAGFHAHRALRQVLLAVSGRVLVRLATPTESWDFILSVGAEALVLQAGLWREYMALEGPATLLVLASDLYHEEDYIRDWREYVEWYAASDG